jgi:AcrR family transcriptional regulator
MSPRLRKAEDADVFAAMVRVMLRVGPEELTLAAIARDAGITAGALVQRFGSKRELMQAHARHAAATLDIGFGPPGRRTKSALSAIYEGAQAYAQLAQSPPAALRNLAYLQRDLADSALRRNLRGSTGERASIMSSWLVRPSVRVICGPIPTFQGWRGPSKSYW